MKVISIQAQPRNLFKTPVKQCGSNIVSLKKKKESKEIFQKQPKNFSRLVRTWLRNQREKDENTADI